MLLGRGSMVRFGLYGDMEISEQCIYISKEDFMSFV